MNLSELATDRAVLLELGQRMGAMRLERNWTQAELADQAGVSKRTVERFEAGESVQLSSLIRICRALGLLAGFDSLIPAPTISPVELLKLQGNKRQRASKKSSAKNLARPSRKRVESKSAEPQKSRPKKSPNDNAPQKWKWGDDS